MFLLLMVKVQPIMSSAAKNLREIVTAWYGSSMPAL